MERARERSVSSNGARGTCGGRAISSGEKLARWRRVSASPDPGGSRVIAIPAVDLRGGACVQLVGGSYDHERLRFDDPRGVARGWAQLGFTRLHLVDLDAATGRGSNEDLVGEILGEREASIQVGGGVRSGDAIERLLAQGADRVVVGTRAIEEPGWIEAMA